MPAKKKKLTPLQRVKKVCGKKYVQGRRVSFDTRAPKKCRDAVMDLLGRGSKKKPAKRSAKARVVTKKSGKKTYGAWWNDPRSY
jgi:hypothetical protein